MEKYVKLTEREYAELVKWKDLYCRLWLLFRFVQDDVMDLDIAGKEREYSRLVSEMRYDAHDLEYMMETREMSFGIGRGIVLTVKQLLGRLNSITKRMIGDHGYEKAEEVIGQLMRDVEVSDRPGDVLEAFEKAWFKPVQGKEEQTVTLWLDFYNKRFLDTM